jgi:hypothetical protein
MSHSIAIDTSGHFATPRGNRHMAILGALLALAMGITVLATVEIGANVVREIPAAVADVGTAISVAPRDLPRDWRWEQPAVEYEHMYRHHEKPKLDWIREGR